MAEDGTIARQMGFFPASRAPLVEYVETNYERTGAVGGFVIYERTGGES